MPTYIHDGTNWQEIVSTSTSVATGDNVYVRTSGNGSMDQQRLLGIDVHDGTVWKTAYTAYTVLPPAKPATPTINRASGWQTRIDQTRISWGSVSGVSGYRLDIMDGNLNTIDTKFYSSTTTNSGVLAIEPGGVVYYFRVYAYATNEAGTTYSNQSSNIRVVSGSQSVGFTIGNTALWRFASSTATGSCRVGKTYSVTKTGSSSDPMVSGYVVVTDFAYTIDDNGIVGLAGSDRYVRESGPGLGGYDYSVGNGFGQFVDPIYKSYVVNAAGGGTWKLEALGGQWTTGTNCVAGNASAVAYNMVINGYETTYNQQ